MELKYRCHWPGCNYETDCRDEIEYHHIVPRELGRRLNCEVVLSFCPTHHRLIWHPECRFGHHAKNGPSKMQVNHIYPTAERDVYAVEFTNSAGTKLYEFFHGDYREPRPQVPLINNA